MPMRGVYTKLVPFEGVNTRGIDSDGGALVGVAIPDSMAGASLQVEASFDQGATWLPVFDSTGTRVQVTIGATARYTLFPQAVLTYGAEAVRLVSPSSETGRNAVLVFQGVV